MRKLISISLATLACLIGTYPTTNAQTIDGSRIGDAYGDAVAVQLTQTQFGNNFSELNAAYAYDDGTNLYLLLTGNLESNFNKLNIFIDSVPGGENVITPDVDNGGNNPTNDNWANVYAGLTFDTGFEADFVVICRNGNFGGDRFDLDFASVGNNSVNVSATDVFGGTFEGSDGALSNGVCVGFDNSNVDGIGGGSMAADADAALLVDTGIELKIPLAELGITSGDTIKVCAHINGSNHDFLSNQFLGGLEPDQGNLGSDGMGNFVSGSLAAVDLNSFSGDQFFCVETGGGGGPTTVVPASFNIVSGSLSGGGLAELGESDNQDLRIFRNPASALAIVTFTGDAISPVASPTTFDITLEGACVARSNVVQRIRLFDFDANGWETVDEQNANRAPNPDLSVTVSPAGDLSRFVGPNNEIRVEVRYRGDAGRLQFAANTDYVAWTIE